MLMLTNRFVIGLHSRLFQVDPVSLPKLYFAWLGNYKILIIMFNLVPYLALRLIL
jgi:hypothetical protein